MRKKQQPDPPKTHAEMAARDAELVRQGAAARADGKPADQFEHARERNYASFLKYVQKNGFRLK